MRVGREGSRAHCRCTVQVRNGGGLGAIGSCLRLKLTASVRGEFTRRRRFRRRWATTERADVISLSFLTTRCSTPVGPKTSRAGDPMADMVSTRPESPMCSSAAVPVRNSLSTADNLTLCSLQKRYQEGRLDGGSLRSGSLSLVECISLLWLTENVSCLGGSR